MRIQYRTRAGFYLVHFSTEPEWSAWADWPDGPLNMSLISMLGEVETRIVDDSGNVVPQTPPFEPAYYQRTSDTSRKHGGITWCDVEPDKAHWKRRDDIKP